MERTLDKSNDRRKWPRQAATERAMVELVGMTIPGEALHQVDRKSQAKAGWADMRDLSQKGMGLRLLRKGDLKPMTKGTPLLMVYTIPSADYHLRAVGKVCWSLKKKDGTTDFGIQFQALTIKDRFHLEMHLQNQAYKA